MLNNPEQELNDEIVEDSDTGTTETASDTEIEDQSDATENDEEELQVDIDGEAISLDTIREWKSGHMMQSDYTKGKQEIAEKRKGLDDLSNKLTSRLDNISSLESKIESLVFDDVEQGNLEELLETDTQEYLKVKSRIDSKKDKLAALRDEISTAQNAVAAEASVQLHTHLGWDDAKKKAEDVAAIDEYRKSVGISDQRLSKIIDPGIMEAFLYASKYHALKDSKPGETKKVTKTTKVTKPKKAPPKTLSLAERMYGTKS